jgi:hypothetical protein
MDYSGSSVHQWKLKRAFGDDATYNTSIAIEDVLWIF